MALGQMNSININLIIAEDHAFIRQALAHMLTANGGFTVIAQASNGKQLLDLIDVREPDIVLLDLDMPVMDGFEVLPILRQNYPKIKTIIVSSYYEKPNIERALRYGARAFLSKDCLPEELFETIRNVHAG